MNLALAHFLPIATVVVGYLARMSEVFARRDLIPGARRETVTFRLFMLCGILAVVGGITEYLLRHSEPWWPTFAAGIVCSVASFAIRRTAIRALGKFWSLHVEMRDGHEFVTSGPFACVRHPVYLSMILELLGIGLIVTAWVTLAVVFGIFIPTMIVRIRIEEHALQEKFGDAYRNYMRTTPAILPGLRSRT